METKNILNLDEKNKVNCHIYIIKNKINDKIYIGQAISHRLNKGKYRYFGYDGRFKDHISEAINNTKKNQCTYLNNAIRKYGKDNFIVELLEICEVQFSDNKEIYYIDKYNSIYPNGYNLTKGGKNFSNKNIFDEKITNQLNIPNSKRGRNFGFSHKDETINKMKKYYEEKKNDGEFQKKIKDCMKNTISNFFEIKKINYLSEQKLELPLEQYIKPVKVRNTNVIHDYLIKINGKKIKIINDDSFDLKYEKLLNLLKISFEKNKNCDDIPKG